MGLFTKKTRYSSTATSQLQTTSPSDISQISTLLSSGADPSALLTTAASEGALPAITILLDGGADPNAFSSKPKWYETPLLAAIHESQMDAVRLLVSRGADINGSFRTGAPLAGTFLTKDISMLRCLLELGADANKKTMGLISPMRAVEGALRCMKHDIRKMPKEGCAKCADRLLLIRMMALLRKHGGRPIVERSSQGTGLLDAYINLIAHMERWEERGHKWAEELGNMTYNDPIGLELVGLMMPPTSIEDMIGIPDFGGSDFGRIEGERTDNTKKYRESIETYKDLLQGYEELRR